MALTDDITDPRLAKALAHPLRIEILRVLGDRTASPSEIADELEAPLTNVSYHIRKLRALGVIKLVRKTPKRGVVEHYYSAVPRLTVRDDVWGDTPSIVKEALVTTTTKRVLGELIKAASSGGFDRSDAQITNSDMRLDERGWGEVSSVLHDAFDRIEQIAADAEKRIGKSKEDAIHAAAVIFLFEMNDGQAA